jgi:hypothetical protein
MIRPTLKQMGPLPDALQRLIVAIETPKIWAACASLRGAADERTDDMLCSMCLSRAWLRPGFGDPACNYENYPAHPGCQRHSGEIYRLHVNASVNLRGLLNASLGFGEILG